MSINFTPHIESDAKPIGNDRQSKNFVSNKLNEAMAAKLSSMYESQTCNLHPGYENVFIVKMDTQEHRIGQIDCCCCDEFQKNLELLANNKVPHGWSQSDDEGAEE